MFRNEYTVERKGDRNMGHIKISDCQDFRNQKKIVELDCPKCHEPEGIEAFVKDQVTVGDSTCVMCGYTISDGTYLK